MNISTAYITPFLNRAPPMHTIDWPLSATIRRAVALFHTGPEEVKVTRRSRHADKPIVEIEGIR